jgi:hypothetical protein
MKTVSNIVIIISLSFLITGFDTLAQAQSRKQKLDKQAEYYALENYATYATNELNSEQQKGYRDGLSAGRKYAKKLPVVAPNISKLHIRESTDYREGFIRGFTAGYHQYISQR